jgi:hypothetical protein
MDPLSLTADPQAFATIEAAKIAAAATRGAAWIQAAAAFGAIIAGGLAYFGAVRQVRLQERAHEVRALAYRFRLGKVIEVYLARITEACSAAKQQLAAYQANRASVKITSFRIAMPPTLQDGNWEVHALLGRRAVELILIVDDASRRLAGLDREIGEDAVTTDAHFEAGRLKPVSENPDGTAVYGPEMAIVDYVEALDGLQRALVALQHELAPGPDTPWRNLLRRRRPSAVNGPPPGF